VADLDWTHLLPFGVVMFGMTLLGFTRRKAGRSLARREYPRLAKRLGLEFSALGPGVVGTLTGTVEGVRVRVESDDRARLVCYPPGDVGIDVRNYAHHKRTPVGYEVVSLGSRADDRWAQNRYARAGRDSGPTLEAVRALLAVLGPDRDRVRDFTADGEKVECVFDFGVPAYLPASVVERLLSAMLAVARSGRAAGLDSSTAAE
jgi:hypothetical protein